MNSFDKAARQYGEYGHIQKDMAAWLAEWLPENHEGRAMEIAAGTGFFTRHLLPWEGSFAATDASHAMLLAGQANHPGIPWKLCAADALPAESLDWIFSSSFLQWAENPVSLFAHWRSRLTNGGRILVGLFAEPTLPELRQLAPDSSPLKWRTPPVWDKALAEAGLVCLRMEHEPRTYRFSSGLELLRIIHRVGAAPRRRLSTGQLRKLLDQYDRTHREGGHVVSTWTFLRVEAAKG